MIPAVAVKLKTKIKQLPSLPAHRPIGYDEERLDKNKTFVRFLYNPGEHYNFIQMREFVQLILFGLLIHIEYVIYMLKEINLLSTI